MADRPFKFNVQAGKLPDVGNQVSKLPDVSNSVYQGYPKRIANNMKFTREEIK